jgi:N-methylhydantoinase B
MNYPAEMLEQEYDVRVERHELRVDSGGPGTFRGGLGLRRVLRFLAPGKLALRGHRHQFPPPGLAGGKPGAPSRFTLERGGTLIPVAPQASAIVTDPGDRLIAETPGGGGYGDPHRRDPVMVARDLALGLITPGHAREAYGVEATELV